MENNYFYMSQTFHSVNIESGEVYRKTAILYLLVQESHGDWYALPHGDPAAQLLSSKFSVRGIPALKVGS